MVSGEPEKVRRGWIQEGPLICHDRELELHILCSIQCGDAGVLFKMESDTIIIRALKTSPAASREDGLHTNTAKVRSLPHYRRKVMRVE